MFVNTEITNLTGMKLIVSSGLSILYNVKGNYIIYHNGERKAFKKNTFIILSHMEIMLIMPKDKEHLLYIIEYSKEFLENNDVDLIFSLDFNSFIDNGLNKEFISKLVNLNSCVDDVCFNKYSLSILRIIDDIAIKEDFNIEYIDAVAISLDKIDEKVDNNFKINIRDISNDINIKTTNLSRYFKKITGLNFSEYRQIKLLEKSSDLLLRDSLNIDEIAYGIGYKHAKSIHDIYKKYLGITPYEYKKKYCCYKKIPMSEIMTDKDYLSFIDRKSNISYKNLYKNYANDDQFIKINNKKVIESEKFNGLDIYSLNNFGTNYIENIIDVDDSIGINLIVVRLEINKKNDYVYLKDLDLHVYKSDIIKLIDTCIDRNITIAIDLSIYKRKIEDYLSDDYRYYLDLDLPLIIDFYKTLFKVYGINLIDKLENIINLQSVKYNEMSEEYISRLRKYHKCRVEVLDLFISDRKIDYSLSFGYRYVKDMREIANYYELYGKGIRKPKKIYYNIVNKHDLSNIPKYNYKKMYDIYVQELESLIDVKNTFKLNHIELVIGEIHSAIEIEDIPREYYYFSMAYIMLDSFLRLDNFKNIDLSFSKREASKKNILINNLFNRKGLKTEFYHLYKMLIELEGDLIYKKRGCIVIQNKSDYNILLYGHLIVDYKYGLLYDFIFDELDYRTIDLNFTEINGTYKVKKETLNLTNGCPEYIFKNFINEESLDYEEYKYIDSINRPKLESKIMKMKDGHIERVKIRPFNIIHINYKKVLDN